MTSERISCRAISASATHSLRRTVLHPDRNGQALAIPGERDAVALHVGVFHYDDLVSVGSIFPRDTAGLESA